MGIDDSGRDLHVLRGRYSKQASWLTSTVSLTNVVLAVALVAPLSGCGVISRGMLYTETIQPLCRDLRGTDLGTKVGTGSSKRVEIPTTQIDLTAEWDSRALGDIARKNGISVVHGCDSRRQSYLLGLWRRDEVIIYGEAAQEFER